MYFCDPRTDLAVLVVAPAVGPTTVDNAAGMIRTRADSHEF